MDCGHDDWHAEIHPIETLVAYHTQSGRLDAIQAANVETVASVVVTGDWAGEPLEFDIWPTPRPSVIARLRFSREPVDDTPTPEHPRGTGIAQNVFPQERLTPTNPNHLHVTLTLGGTALTDPPNTGDMGDVSPDTSRRLAARYHLWWE